VNCASRLSSIRCGLLNLPRCCKSVTVLRLTADCLTADIARPETLDARFFARCDVPSQKYDCCKTGRLLRTRDGWAHRACLDPDGKKRDKVPRPAVRGRNSNNAGLPSYEKQGKPSLTLSQCKTVSDDSSVQLISRTLMSSCGN
jgi:hypothetical protein